MQGDTIAEARLVLGGVAPIPWRCLDAEAALAGRRVDAETCALAGEQALLGAEPLEHNAYKVRLIRGLTRRLLLRLADQD